MRDRVEVEVLVVGAGPTGMLAALRLARKGHRVLILDEASHTAMHSHACLVHAESLRLLRQEGLEPALVEWGRPISRVAFYEGTERRAEITCPPEVGPVLALPQNVLEDLLESQLQKAGLSVAWNHRLESLYRGPDNVLATVNRLTESAKGYIIPEWEWVVDKTFEVQARYVVGADGRHSTVRRSLGLAFKTEAEPTGFGVFEAVPEEPVPEEVRIGLDAEGLCAFSWPLPDGRCRGAFRLGAGRQETSWAKDRQNVWIVRRGENEQEIRRIRQQMSEQAPWFHACFQELDWVAAAEFAPGLAQSYGGDGCWLIGDAAHSAWPAGVQSMNAGLREAATLADTLSAVLLGEATPGAIPACSQRFFEEWSRLLDKHSVRALPGADPWVAERASLLAACLPATGTDLMRLLATLGLSWESAQACTDCRTSGVG